MTASMKVARRLGLQWGVHAVHTRDVSNFEEMVGKAKRMALRHHLAEAGDRMVIMAGVPFKTAGSTNVIHVVKLAGDELEALPQRVGEQRRALRAAISRARKPSGPTFFAKRRPASPWSQTRPQQGGERVGAAASRPPTIPASVSPLPETPRPGPPPRYFQARAVGRDDMALRRP